MILCSSFLGHYYFAPLTFCCKTKLKYNRASLLKLQRSHAYYLLLNLILIQKSYGLVEIFGILRSDDINMKMSQKEEVYRLLN